MAAAAEALAGVAPPLEPPGASLAVALVHWRDFDLETRRPKLDEVGSARQTLLCAETCGS
jgi:hypothetical protein